MNPHALRLRELLAGPDPVVAPGVFSPLIARLVADAGFPAAYFSGAGVAGGMFGQPDVGLVTLSELVDAARRTVECAGLPLVCDADTGFGGLLNVRRTVRDLEAAGVAGLHIEDQGFPRRCGFLGGHTLVPAPEMVDRLKVALDARRDAETVIIARTEMFGSASLDETVERATRYGEAGADLIFCNGVTTVEQAEQLSRQVRYPQLYNVSSSGMTPHLDRDRLQVLGYRMIIYPAQALFLAMRSIQQMLADLKDGGTIAPWLGQMIDFREWKRISGVDETDAFEQSHARD
jgi:2-methylisocitrate lyase-like PEP mutase family enzyme